MDTWLLKKDPPLPAAVNMAVDAALLDAAGDTGLPVLRLYAWSEAAASFGYFQSWTKVAGLTPLRPLVRRPTGGGLVLHDRDWTYCLAIPTGHSWYGLSAVESYRRVHGWMAAALQSLGLNVQLAPGCDPEGPGRCFAGHERFDLLLNNHKVGGAAQRRRRDGLLIQGSVRGLDGFCQRRDWEASIQEQASREDNVHWHPWQPDPEWESRVARLAQEQFGAAGFLHRR